VMILHMGGMFGSKPETFDRFRESYAKLSPSIKRRLVLENDDMCYSVHDLLPICEELNIPLCLDWHHSNIIYDSSKIREGTQDIMEYLPQIKATWTRKGITQKMHYSEPRPEAVTNMQRRRHSPRVATLPPCDPMMDLMIEAKDKEQAVFELMRIFKLPGFEKAVEIVPHVRVDENAKPSRKKGAEIPVQMDEEDIGMGGPEGRVYWPPGKEEWLKPKKRVIKPKVEANGEDVETILDEGAEEALPILVKSKGRTKKVKTEEDAPPAESRTKGRQKKVKSEPETVEDDASIAEVKSKSRPKTSKQQFKVPTPAPSDIESKTIAGRRRSGRATKVDYEEVDTLD